MNTPGKRPGLALVIGVGRDKGAADASGNQDCVPLSALNMPDEQDQMEAPSVGDKVQYTVEGTVTRIDGDEAYVQRDSINGQPVGDDDQPPTQPPAPGDASDQSSDGSDYDPQSDNSQDYGALQQMAQGVQLQ